jgi:dolichol-phosphate mannosyltransferase
LALTLSRFNVPIMGINAVVQALVPPPKYSVDRLVPCRMGTATKVDELFIIERGPAHVSELGHAAALDRMIQNTDDAYGFPPFRYVAPAITIDGQDYLALRAREREILADFLSGVRTRVVASECYGWADDIARMVARDSAADDAATGEGLHAWPRWEARLAATGVLA